MGSLLPQLFDLKAGGLSKAGIVSIVEVTVDIAFIGKLFVAFVRTFLILTLSTRQIKQELANCLLKRARWPLCNTLDDGGDIVRESVRLEGECVELVTLRIIRGI